jgi:hypothetical protein
VVVAGDGPVALTVAAGRQGQRPIEAMMTFSARMPAIIVESQ